MEQTLIILKPDAVQRGIIGEIVSRFEKMGLKLIGAKMIKPDNDLADRHYPIERREFIEGMGNKTLENYKEQGKDPQAEFGHEDPHKIGLELQKWLVEYLTSDPVLALVFEGPHAVELARKVVGHTLPSKALPGTIRGDFSFDSSALANESKRPIRNLIHASGNVEEARFEIGLWFSQSELFQYDAIHQAHMTK
ncbi:nucleoside-diphosphate kinase [Candidatus Saccharibacteria bacterium]|nr:MAG: nucleoside-diphosphate kinase [Candidatus Saccharibacteria bacterium]